MGAVETINGPGTSTISRMIGYTYDNLYRLTKETVADTSSPTAGPSPTIDYGPQTGNASTTGYDRVGNRRSRRTPPALATLPDQTFTFDAQDHLGGSLYDLNGNTTVETLPGPAISPNDSSSPAHHDQYDFENRLVQRSDGTMTITIVYDGDGNRVSKIVTGPNAETRYYLVDNQNPTGYAQVLEESIATGDTRSVTRQYTYGHALVSATLDPFSQTPQTLYYGYDGHGNVRYLTDANGNITDTYTYDAFGVLISSTGSTANNYLYCGEQFDFDLGTYYLRARHLNPNTGRFWTMDTYEGDNEDSASLHKYVYAAGNPGNLSDPSGRFFDSISTLFSTLYNSYLTSRDAARVSTGGSSALKGIGLVYLLITMNVALTYEAGLFDSSDEMDIVNLQTQRRANPTRSGYAYVNYRCVEFAQDAESFFRRLSEVG